MAVKARRVAVIGAGPAGAIATDALAKEQAFDTIRVFDRRPVVGGTWVYTPHLPVGIPNLASLMSGDADLAVPLPSQFPAETPKSAAVNDHQIRFSDSAQHEHLHSNITPEIMTFTQEPFPPALSAKTLSKYGADSPFRHREVIRQWISSVFHRGNLDRYLSLQTTVERAEKIHGEWILTLRREGAYSNYWWQERFDALVVASGHYHVPWFPSVPGLLLYNERFPGRILHSKHFRSAEKFAGKRVVVVGGSVSAHEILHEILEVAQTPVYASLRGPPIPSFGWAPFLHPHVAVRKQISKLDAETGDVYFEDGTLVKGVDYIVFATGYTFSMPWLGGVQERIRGADRRLPGVFMHTWDILDETLAFVGMLGGGFTFKVYEWQAVAVARHLAGRARPLPSIAEQQAWEARRVALKGGGKDYYSIAPDYKEFFEFLREIAGDPAEGTAGRVLPKFDPGWLKVWTEMVAHKIRGFEESRRKAEEELALQAHQGQVKAKL